MALHPVTERVTQRIADRSRPTRADYLARVDAARQSVPARTHLGCGNLAHGFAAAGEDKPRLRGARGGNIGIVSAYNDMLSAHQPYEPYPALIRMAARNAGGSAQVAGGVPAMCDGVTQGRAGMEMSLFSRDTIALATAVALSHDMFDAVLCLGICDKIVPGLLIGALSFGHLPVIFVPGGPMPSGLPNKEKAAVRQRYAEGKATREELLAAESASYHSPGTCTFYGTANSNQMLMEVMGLHLPGSAFVNPHTPLRDALTVAATEQALRITALGDNAGYRPLAHTIDEKAIVNAMVGLAATGGSTNHALHLVAIARAAGLIIDWDDLDELSRVTPLLARVYPNGSADVNHFHAAGGIGFVIRELLDAGLMHADIRCVHGGDLRQQQLEPYLDDTTLRWREPPAQSRDAGIVRPATEPFDSEGGLRRLQGNLGRAVAKISAVAPEYRAITAPARVFDTQDAMLDAFKAGALEGDFVAVVRGQGPRANGMPELHKLTPPLSVLQDRGQRIALLTDGRMSGASGKVLAAIHVSPEAADAGANAPISRIRDGDLLHIDADAGTLDALVDAAEWDARAPELASLHPNRTGLGRELFALMRTQVGTAEQGACSLFVAEAP
ncbi:phosphogluconate dehydratase [Lysobacter solisilvae (ex Woo and Kim 2020)]|uniref:Phosphogluconate dehydratase n=1 Tax=Agrilutibacter terrestris TaxID=2865112 RepID=A0A7H0FU62_9GAMM|nr:phosphogluconate dehydratase [Lysobacter terrestris]QNP39578.1 phosphogluconate dehydratase [Lysobacter terrestris]